MSRTFNYERAATILAEAAFGDDETVLRRYGIAPRTLVRYRERLRTDPKMALFVQEKKGTLEREWANEIGPTIRAAIDFLRRAAQSADPTDPAAVRAVAEALKTLSEIEMTKGVLDARLSGAPPTPRPYA